MKKICFLPVLLLALMAACSDDEPKQIASVSSDDFTKHADGKIWVDGSSVNKPENWEIVSSSGETFNQNPWTGGIASLEGFVFSGKSFTAYSLNIAHNPPRFTQTSEFTFDQATGLCTTDVQLSPWGVNDNSLYIESISDEQIVVRYNYGILPIGYKEGEASDSYTPDPGSYVRQTFYALPADKVEQWTAQYAAN